MSTASDLASQLIHVAFVDSVPVLRPLNGLFLRDEAKEFTRLFEKLKAKSIKLLVLDLHDCTNISSDGLGSVATCWNWCQEKHKGFMSVVLPADKESEVVNLFDITGLTRMIGSALQRNVKDALAYLAAFGRTSDN